MSRPRLIVYGEFLGTTGFASLSEGKAIRWYQPPGLGRVDEHGAPTMLLASRTLMQNSHMVFWLPLCASLVTDPTPRRPTQKPHNNDLVSFIRVLREEWEGSFVELACMTSNITEDPVLF